MVLLILAGRCHRLAPQSRLISTDVTDQERIFPSWELITMLFYFAAAKSPIFTLLDVTMEPRSSLAYHGHDLPSSFNRRL